jgi:NDP-mannose synthase
LKKLPLGTMGCLPKIKNLPKNFLVLNGDIITNLNFRKFFNKHINSKKIFTISAISRKNKVDYGVLKIDQKNNLINFFEKPISKYLVSMGVYALNNKVIKYIPKDNKIFGFDHLMKIFLKKKINVQVLTHDKKWLDIGRLEDYMKIIDKFRSGF